MVAGEHVPAKMQQYAATANALHTKDQIYSAMVVYGLLTYENGKVFIPNKEKGVIDIRLLDEVDSIRVEIEDNGKGIAAKDLGNIFERFYRTDASRNSMKGGSGIGLSIVKKIIEDHGGYIWATSKEGEGTCLHFVIRKYREAEADE